jgi:hypothetical protein
MKQLGEDDRDRSDASSRAKNGNIIAPNRASGAIAGIEGPAECDE